MNERASGSVASIHSAHCTPTPSTYLLFRRATRHGKWSFSNGWAAHDGIHVCWNSRLKSLFITLTEMVWWNIRVLRKDTPLKHCDRHVLFFPSTVFNSVSGHIYSCYFFRSKDGVHCKDTSSEWSVDWKKLSCQLFQLLINYYFGHIQSNHIIVNKKSLGFGLSVGPKKQF